MRLYQLRHFFAHIERRCVVEKWTNVKGELLTPETVTLYDATRYVIKPATAARRCSFVELVARGPQKPIWFVSHWWGEPVALFLRCLEQHAADHHLSDDAAYWVCAYAPAAASTSGRPHARCANLTCPGAAAGTPTTSTTRAAT